jgi:hypothetical protein
MPSYLVGSIPFRRRSSNSTADSSTSAIEDNTSRSSSESPSPPTTTTTTTSVTNTRRPSYLSGHTSYLRCKRCLSHICSTSQIVSKGFTGQRGRAYLVAATHFAHKVADGDQLSKKVTSLANTRTDAPRARQLVTGMHTVADLECAVCGFELGWKYIEAEEEREQYKVGKFILETKHVVKNVCWEEEDDEEMRVLGTVDDDGKSSWEEDMSELGAKKSDEMEGTKEVAKEVEFDSEDEAECEALFAGEWSAGLAKARRRRKARTMSSHY